MKFLSLLFFWATVTNAAIVYGPGSSPGVTNLAGRSISGTAPNNNEVLTWDSTLGAWKPAAGGGGGVTTMAAVGAVPNANGATISGVNLNLQPADGSFPGVMTTGTQIIAGDKNFTGVFRVGTSALVSGAPVFQAMLPGTNAMVFFAGSSSAGTHGALGMLTLGDIGGTDFDFSADFQGFDSANTTVAPLNFNRQGGPVNIGSTGVDTKVHGPLLPKEDLFGDGGDQFYGFLQNQVASTTVTITAAQCGSTFVSNSIDVMTLPEASTVLGCRLSFVCGTADDFDVNPNDATDQILSVSTTNGTTGVVTLAPAAGDAIRCTDIGGAITLEAIGANAWAQVAGGNGIWTDVN